jgi:hypothetical protein
VTDGKQQFGSLYKGAEPQALKPTNPYGQRNVGTIKDNPYFFCDQTSSLGRLHQLFRVAYTTLFWTIVKHREPKQRNEYQFVVSLEYVCTSH